MSEEALRIVPSTASIETGLSEAIRTVIDGVVGFVGVLTTTGVLIEANEPAISAANLTRKDVIGKPFWDCYWWSFDATVQDQLRDAVRRATAGQSIRYDVEIRIANDCRMIIDFQLLPHFDATGNVDFLIPSGVDITDRKAQ